MNWDGLVEDDDDDDRFFESYERISSAIPLDLLARSDDDDDDDDFEDSRMSFVSSASFKSIHPLDSITKPTSILDNYGMWIAEPGDVKERRKRLLQGMGLSSNKDLLKLASSKIVRAITRKLDVETSKVKTVPMEELKREKSSPLMPVVLIRSRSDGDIEAFSVRTKQRKEELIGQVSKQRLTRTFSGQIGLSLGICQYSNANLKRFKNRTVMPTSKVMQSVLSDDAFGSFFLIKNLDTGKEFIVKESNGEGMWNKLSDVQTGKQLTMEEFEKSVGYSPVVKELMQREIVSRAINGIRHKNAQNSLLTKSFRNSKRRGVALLKNIKEVANSMSSSPVEQKDSKNNKSQWVKARQQGKSYKEFTALHMSQDIQAHDGAIWTIKFSGDGCFLATAGEDRIIHVWEVQECEVMSARLGDDSNLFGSTPIASIGSDRPPLAEITPKPSDRKVVDWTDINEMVTAACYTPDGQVPTSNPTPEGFCYRISQRDQKVNCDLDCKLEQKDSFDIRSKKKVHAKKITGFQFSPWNPAEVLVTSADSRIRIFSGSDLTQKLRGYRNTSSQISASFSPDGEHVISASEDSQVYIWKLEESKNQGGGKVRRVTIHSHEHFQCKDVSVAIPWPGSAKNEAPIVEIHSKRHSKRLTAPSPQSRSNSPTRDDKVIDTSSRRHLPPLPKKNNVLERIPSCMDDDFSQSGRIDPGIGVSESFSSSSQSLPYGDSPSIFSSRISPSQSWSSSWSLFDGSSNQGSHTMQATAWGLVIVTASLGGKIRVYQNFGLPLKVSRQALIFRDH